MKILFTALSSLMHKFLFSDAYNLIINLEKWLCNLNPHFCMF
ncbi:unnamed protein product [Spirodela intermedia]|uniref:Uncharacterized protein n=1 Tax=Spirodela intermedia TaxID=51605 RepID=A0ABN7EAY5_SPIIN|nr:unnamed protein product [Spirodela intermedia]